MTATLSELVGRARTFVRDSGGGFIDDDDLAAWVNEAQTDIAARTQVLQHQVEGDIWSTFSHLDMPPDAANNPDMIKILSLRLEADDVEFTSDDAFNFSRDNGLTPASTIARIFDNLIEVYPIPDEGVHYVLRYTKIPDPLVDGSDEHELPLQMERKLVEFAVSRAKAKDGEMAESREWLSLYEFGLPTVSTGHELLMTDSLRIERGLNAWDLQRGASHL